MVSQAGEVRFFISGGVSGGAGPPRKAPPGGPIRPPGRPPGAGSGPIGIYYGEFSLLARYKMPRGGLRGPGGPIWADLGRFWPILGDFGGSRGGQIGPNLADFGPILAEFGRFWADFGRIWADSGPILARKSRQNPGFFGDFWRFLAIFGDFYSTTLQIHWRESIALRISCRIGSPSIRAPSGRLPNSSIMWFKMEIFSWPDFENFFSPGKIFFFPEKFFFRPKKFFFAQRNFFFTPEKLPPPPGNFRQLVTDTEKVTTKKFTKKCDFFENFLLWREFFSKIPKLAKISWFFGNFSKIAKMAFFACNSM